MGSTKGGLNTKLHVATDGLGQPQAMILTAGNIIRPTYRMHLHCRKTAEAGTPLWTGGMTAMFFENGSLPMT